MSDEHCVVLCPWASRFPFETWLVPRRHPHRFMDTSDDALRPVGAMLQRLLATIETISGYTHNAALQIGPLDATDPSAFHWRWEVFPRLVTPAGFEWTTGVFINPVIQRATGSDEQEEGCLSLPGLYANVHRSTNVRVEAYDLSGEKITMDTAGLMARAIQHEIDHLDGVLFIDRLSDIAKAAVRHKIEEFEADAAMRIRTGTAEEMDEIERRWQEIEDRYCQ